MMPQYPSDPAAVFLALPAGLPGPHSAPDRLPLHHLPLSLHLHIPSFRRLTTLARAATWLGNDETHYVRQHPDYTLKELKAFADAFITFIDADLAYEAALKLVTP